MTAQIRPLRFVISAKDNTGQAFRTLKGNLNTASQMWDRMKDRASKAVSWLSRFGLALQGLMPIWQRFRGFIDLWDVQAKAVAQVERAIEATGGAAGRTSDQLQAMASRLQDVTLFGDEAILGEVVAPLLVFDKVHGEVFDRAVETVLDYATAMDQDLRDAAEKVGEALADPAGAIETLAEAGVIFTEAQKAMIAALVETGNLAHAQGIILAALEGRIRGAAEAAAEAGAGPITQLQNAFGDLGEEVGRVLTEGLEPTVPILRDMVQWFTELDPAMQRVIVTFGAFAAAIIPLLGILGLFVAAIGAISAPVAAVIAAIGALVAAFVAFREEVTAAVVATRDVVAAVLQEIAAFVERVLTALADAIDRFVARVQAVIAWARGQEVTINIGLRVRTQFRNVPGTSNDMQQLIQDSYRRQQGAARIDGAFDLFEQVGNTGTATADDIRDAFERANRGITTSTQETVPTVTGAMDTIGSSGASNFKTLGDTGVNTAGKLKRHWLDFRSVFSGVLGELFDVEKGFKDFGKRLVDILVKMADRILDAALRPLEQALGNVLNQAIHMGGAGGLFGGGGGEGGGVLETVIGGVFGAGASAPAPKPGFASGGSFTVSGSGGVDSQVVAFRATPGERVQVRRPGEDAGRGDVHVHFHGVGDAESFRRSEGQITASLARAVRRGQRGL